MEFSKWLKIGGYFPIDVIISNYVINGFSDEEIEKSVERIKNNYRHWCSDNKVEPSF